MGMDLTNKKSGQCHVCLYAHPEGDGIIPAGCIQNYSEEVLDILNGYKKLVNLDPVAANIVSDIQLDKLLGGDLTFEKNGPSSKTPLYVQDCGGAFKPRV